MRDVTTVLKRWWQRPIQNNGQSRKLRKRSFLQTQYKITDWHMYMVNWYHSWWEIETPYTIAGQEKGSTIFIRGFKLVSGNSVCEISAENLVFVCPVMVPQRFLSLSHTHTEWCMHIFYLIRVNRHSKHFLTLSECIKSFRNFFQAF